LLPVKDLSGHLSRIEWFIILCVAWHALRTKWVMNLSNHQN